MINDFYLFYFEIFLFLLIIYEINLANRTIFFISIFDIYKTIKEIIKNKKNKK